MSRAGDDRRQGSIEPIITSVPTAPRSALGIATASGCLLFGALAFAGGIGLALYVNREAAPKWLSRSDRIAAPQLAAETHALKLAEITDEQRIKGKSECDPPDPLGLGPYSPYQRVALGRMLVPQKGGHTDDMGFDVVVHFNGGDAARKMLVQVTRGVALVLVERGSPGDYKRAFGSPAIFPELRRSIEAGLRKHCNDSRAHIRKLAVSSWSAGELAIHQLLEQKQPGIDGVVILDGLHTAWAFGRRHTDDPASLQAGVIRPEIEYARRAASGESILVLTHSAVEPVSYPSTRITADLLLSEIGQKRAPLESEKSRFEQVTAVDVGGLHVWGYAGKNELAHCAQIQHIARAVSEVLEPAWGTPAMDRKVANTPLPRWERKRR